MAWALLLAPTTVAFAFSRHTVIDDGAVDRDMGTRGVDTIGDSGGRGRGRGLGAGRIGACVGIRGADDAHDFAVLFEVFVFAGAVVVAELLAFIEELDAARIIGLGLSGCCAADITDTDVALGNVEGGKM